jgi:uncharacterized protein (TIGR03067 family)
MQRDLDLLEGSWTVTALEVDGQAMPAAMLADARITIKGSRFTSTGMGGAYEGTLELDTSASPPRLDMKFDAGPEKGNTNLGIYQLEGDTWKLCLATRGTVRPASFASTPGSGFAVETLVREGAPAAHKAKGRAPKKSAPPIPAGGPTPAGPATEFEGEWSMLAGVMDGKAMDASLLKWVKRVTRGNQTTVVAGPQTMLKVEFTFDPAPSPRTIDYLNLAGAHKGKAQQGIYKFEGDVLTVCVSAPGAARPREFESAAGDGRTLTVWKRA